MGYRSDVKYVMQFRDNEHCAEFVAVQKMKGDVYKEAVEGCEIKGDRIYFHADDWKWYEGSFPVVDAHCRMMEEVSDFGGSYYFMRLGETHEDVEERYMYSEDDSIEPPWDAIVFHRHTDFEY